ncbi:MAG: hypothetical protein C5B49_01325 [Bdellovibrio sp.]|nr:MAG: hypothetical protein C5B49_01325 [Bdellovibrio sp.]
MEEATEAIFEIEAKTTAYCAACLLTWLASTFGSAGGTVISSRPMDVATLEFTVLIRRLKFVDELLLMDAIAL